MKLSEYKKLLESVRDVQKAPKIDLNVPMDELIHQILMTVIKLNDLDIAPLVPYGSHYALISSDGMVRITKKDGDIMSHIQPRNLEDLKKSNNSFSSEGIKQIAIGLNDLLDRHRVVTHPYEDDRWVTASQSLWSSL